jgi:WD40 repeat protein
MTEYRNTLERELERLQPPRIPFDQLVRRRDRKHRDQRIRAGVLGLAIAIAVGWLGINAIRSTPPVPVGPPPDDGLLNVPPPEGIFSEVGGWIALRDGVRSPLVAVAPDGSQETVLLDEPRVVAQDWSSDGSRLLLARFHKGRVAGDLVFVPDLTVLEPDGSETTLARFPDDTWFSGAAFSPDGAKVVYTSEPNIAPGPAQLWTVASDGSRKPKLVLDGDYGLYEPTYSPDGTRIAYFDGGGDNTHRLRIVNSDGTDLHELIDGTSVFGGGHINGLEWSPDGSLLAIGLGGSGIYTIRPDGTDLRLLIPGASDPTWSPDGSLIAYTPSSTDINHMDDGWGVWVANADGSDPRMLLPHGYAGPWNPGGPADQT